MGPERRIVSYPEEYLCSTLSVIVPLEGALKFKNPIPRWTSLKNQGIFWIEFQDSADYKNRTKQNTQERFKMMD